MIDMICHCGNSYSVKLSDLERGNGLSCNRSCAGKRRTHTLPAALRVDGVEIKKQLKKRKRVSEAASIRHMMKGVG